MLQEFGKCFRRGRLDALDIAGDTGNEFARRIEMKEAKRLKKDFLEHIVAQIADDRVSEISNCRNGTVFRARFDHCHTDEQHQKNAPIQSRNVESRSYHRNGD